MDPSCTFITSRMRRAWLRPAPCLSRSVANALTQGSASPVRLPRGVAHRWWNQSGQPLAFEGSARPLVDLDRYLQAVFEVMNAGARNRSSLFYLAHVALRHRRTQTARVMAPPLQAILFRVLIVLGTLMGRYRGTEWPGCPARCTGAPEVDT